MDEDRVTVAELGHAIGAKPLNGNLGVSYAGASIDSREVARGNVFFAIRGRRTDGHAFVRSAARRGAAAAVVERRPFPGPGSLPLLRAASSVAALGRGAAWHRRRFRAPVVGITGSNGKTTVKDMTAWVLEAAAGRGGVTATRGNLNNHLGVPLTLFRMGTGTRAAVVEMAMNARGEIRRLARMALPSVGVILNAGEAHLRRFASRAQVVRAKAEMLEEIPCGGWAIVNADDPRLWEKRRLTRGRVLGFGARRGDVRAERISLGGSGLPRFFLRTPDGRTEVRLRVAGAHNALNAAAAAAVGWVMGVSTAAIAARLEGFRPRASMRMEKIRLRNGATGIVDCYNSNPDSCRAAFAWLRDARVDSPVLVLGEMREMGRHSGRVHGEIGGEAAGLSPKLVAGIGREARALVAAARKRGAPTFWAPTAEAAEGAVRGVLGRGVTVLFKASRMVGLERLVDKLRRAKR